MLWHLNYEINKEYYRDLFYRHVHEGKWHWTCKKQQRLYWFQLLCGREQDGFLREEIRSVEEALGILGMDTYPRFNYQVPNTRLLPHIDEDEIIAININLLDTTPTIKIEDKSYSYECALIDVGHQVHEVIPDPNERLILKFAIRNQSYNDVYDRVLKFLDKA
jgi:hypothetical protein